MIVQPPFAIGAVHVSVAVAELPKFTAGSEIETARPGAEGVAIGVTRTKADAFTGSGAVRTVPNCGADCNCTAVTRNVYALPFVRPFIV